MNALLTGALLLLASAPLRAGNFSNTARGTNAADFLNLGAGARATALGDAYSAAVDDANALYWNPAAMTRVQKYSATLMHASYLNMSYFDYAAYVSNRGPKIGSFGIGLQYFSAGKIIQTDATGSDLGNFYPYDLAVYWSYAREFRGYSLGANIKLVNSRILTTTSAGAIDLGLLSPACFDDRLRWALTATNLGGDTMQFQQEKAPLPLTLKAGSAYKLNADALVTFDIGLPQRDRPYAATGIEYWLSRGEKWSFAGRAGFNTRTLGGINGFTGISLGFGLASRGFGIDYAFVPYGGLGQAHRISATYNF